MSTELERHKAAVQAAITGLRSLGLDYAHLAHAIEERINEALHPKPEMEELPVVRWMCLYCQVVTMDNTEEPPEGNYCCQHHVGHLKLTGTLKRPKPQPMERMVSVEGKVDGCGDTFASDGDYLFKSHPECHCKRGTFTFTWTEQPKGGE